MPENVSLVNTLEGPEELLDSIYRSVKLINFNPERDISNVIIKPNLCYYWDASTGATTDPRLVASIIDWLRAEYGASIDIKIAESDATAMRTHLAFRTLGYEKLAKEKGVELFNLSNDDTVVYEDKINGHDLKFSVPKSLLETDLLINVPKLKIIRMVRITCAMKNIFGCIATRRKITYHKYLNEAIVGINKIVKPHLGFVDGIVGLGRYPVKLNLILAGTSSYGIDHVASKIVCNNSGDVNILKLAQREGLGKPQDIKTVGEGIEKYRKIFPRESRLPTEHLWGAQLFLLKTYARIVGDITPPIID